MTPARTRHSARNLSMQIKNEEKRDCPSSNLRCRQPKNEKTMGHGGRSPNPTTLSSPSSSPSRSSCVTRRLKPSLQEAVDSPLLVEGHSSFTQQRMANELGEHQEPVPYYSSPLPTARINISNDGTLEQTAFNHKERRGGNFKKSQQKVREVATRGANQVHYTDSSEEESDSESETLAKSRKKRNRGISVRFDQSPLGHTPSGRNNCHRRKQVDGNGEGENKPDVDFASELEVESIEELIPDPVSRRQSSRSAAVDKRPKPSLNLMHNLFLEPTLARQANKRKRKEREERRKLKKQRDEVVKKTASRSQAERSYLLDDFKKTETAEVRKDKKEKIPLAFHSLPDSANSADENDLAIAPTIKAPLRKMSAMLPQRSKIASFRPVETPREKERKMPSTPVLNSRAANKKRRSAGADRSEAEDDAEEPSVHDERKSRTSSGRDDSLRTVPRFLAPVKHSNPRNKVSNVHVEIPRGKGRASSALIMHSRLADKHPRSADAGRSEADHDAEEPVVPDEWKPRTSSSRNDSVRTNSRFLAPDDKYPKPSNEVSDSQSTRLVMRQLLRSSTTAMPIASLTPSSAGMLNAIARCKVFAIEHLSRASDIASIYAGIAVMNELYARGEQAPQSVIRLCYETGNMAKFLLKSKLREEFTKPRLLGGLSFSSLEAHLLLELIIESVHKSLSLGLEITSDKLLKIDGIPTGGVFQILPVIRSIGTIIRQRFLLLCEDLINVGSGQGTHHRKILL